MVRLMQGRSERQTENPRPSGLGSVNLRFTSERLNFAWPLELTPIWHIVDVAIRDRGEPKASACR